MAIRKQKQALIIALIASSILLILKFGAWIITDSNAILSDALESIVNVMAGAMALFSFILSHRPKDENHPYGHGKVEFISAGIEGVLISFAGIAILVKAGYNLIQPHEIESLDTGLIILTFAGAVNFALGFMLIRSGKRTDNIVLISNGKHLLTDAWSSVGVFIGVLLTLLTGYLWIDNLTAGIFGGYILIEGIRIMRKSLSGVMDEADPKQLDRIAGILEKRRVAKWIDVHNLRVIRYGTILHIDAHMVLPRYLNLEETHHEMDAVEHLLKNELGELTEVFIHTDPCAPNSCDLCSIENCPVRSEPFVERLVWTTDRLTHPIRQSRK